MKKIILISLLIVLGCKDKNETEFLKTQEQRKEKSKNKDSESIADSLLELEGEKIALLSIIKGTPKDTLKLILKDYIDKTFPLVTDTNEVDLLIENISKKYNISKIKIASIIFSYNYEILTKDEIEQNAIENE